MSAGLAHAGEEGDQKRAQAGLVVTARLLETRCTVFSATFQLLCARSCCDLYVRVAVTYIGMNVPQRAAQGAGQPGAHPLPVSHRYGSQRPLCDTPTQFLVGGSRDVTPEEFYERFEIPARPVVIDGFAEGTPAQHWTAQSLLEKYGEMKFKCGEDDDGYPERVHLKHFMEYCATEGQKDDSPLYVFDSRFADKGDGKSLLRDYRLPWVLPPAGLLALTASWRSVAQTHCAGLPCAQVVFSRRFIQACREEAAATVALVHDWTAAFGHWNSH